MRTAPLLSACVACLLVLPAAGGQNPPSSPAATALGTLEIVEDLRLFVLLNAIRPTREQGRQLAAVAAEGREGLAALEVEASAKLEQQREALLAAREALLRGDTVPPSAESQILTASRAAEAARAQKSEALVAALAAKLRPVLNAGQAALIENELAPTADQSWRRYSGAVTPPAAGGAGPRPPMDPARWVADLRALRSAAQVGDPQREIDSFAKKAARGLKGGTPLFDRSLEQGRAVAVQALSMPPAVFAQREWVLARALAKQEWDVRAEQRSLDGRPPESFDSHRWLVQHVLLSPRAEHVLRDLLPP